MSPAYNFTKRFAQLVESGEKSQTIRAFGKRRHAEPGDRLQLYTGMRTKACRKLIEPDPICSACLAVEIRRFRSGKRKIKITGAGALALGDVALADGFGCMDELIDWVENAYGLPFYGVLIRWDASETQKKQILFSRI